MARHMKAKRTYSTDDTDWIDYMFGAIGILSLVIMSLLFAGALTQ